MVCINLGLKAEDAIQYHKEYSMLLGYTEFTKVYHQIKDPWAYVDLVRLVQNAGMSDEKVVELLKIADGHLPNVMLEYDSLKKEIYLLKAEKYSLEAELSNIARTYQLFVDRNVSMNKRINELQMTINELEARLEAKMTELQKTEINESISESQENKAYITNLNSDVKQEDIIITKDVLIPSPYSKINHPNEINSSNLSGHMFVQENELGNYNFSEE